MTKQDISYEEICKRQRDLLEMKKSIKMLENKLNNGMSLKEIYSDINTECSLSRNEKTEKIESQMLEVRKFDEMLQIKSRDLKEVKIERMKITDEFQQSLKKMSETTASEIIKQNAEQYLKLLQNESDNSGENVNVSTIQKRKKKEKGKLSTKEPGTFIKRNIELAKCGDGVLSLTDEEKLRLKVVLNDLDIVSENIKNESSSKEEKMLKMENEYQIDVENKIILQGIDEKLKDHEKMKLKSPNKEVDLQTFNNRNGIISERAKERSNNPLEKELNRLQEVDKLLTFFNTATYEEINPLVEEDLMLLIEESKQSLCITNDEERVEESLMRGIKGKESTEHELRYRTQFPSKETILELVATAKQIMPNFRFRYGK